MSLLVPKTKYSRLQLPHGEAGSTEGLEEPANAMPGTLSFDPDREVVRVKASTESGDWVDVGVTGTPMTNPPVTSLWDDNFLDVDTLATNYIVWNATDNVNMSRAGDVVFPVGIVSSTQYNASVYGGVLYFQIQSNKTVYIYRAVDVSSGCMYTGHIAQLAADGVPTAGNSASASLFIANNSAGRPNTSEIMQLGVLGGSEQVLRKVVHSGVTTSDTVPYGFPTAAGYAMRCTTDVTSWAYNVEDGRASRFDSVTPIPTRAWFGFSLSSGNAASASQFALYFLREQDSSGWWVSTAAGASGLPSGGGGGGGGGSITSIAAGAGISVANPTGPVVTVAADIAAGANITITGTHPMTIASTGGGTLVGDVNGALASNQVNAIHETSGPTQLTIGAISDGQVLTRSGSTVIGSGGGMPSGNPYIDPPLVPNALDDEFDSGSPDLATRGWTIRNSAGTTMTRVGDIAPWSVGSLTSTQYNSTLIGSFLHIEVALGTDVRIYKSISWASGSGSMFWARLGQPQYRSSASTQTNYIGISAWYNSGGNPDGNNRVFSQVSTLGTTAAVNVQTGRVTAGVASFTTNNSAPPAPDIYGVKLLTGTTSWDCFVANSQTGSLATDATGTMISTSMAYAGLNLIPAATTGAATTNSQIFTVDFVRFASGSSAWIGQAPKPVVWSINASIPVAANITTQINPLHWWRADNTVQSGGLVDTIVDNGSLAKDFTQTGAARCPTATDGDGNTYLAFDGVTDFYQAGVAADWTTFNNGTGFTVAALVDLQTITAGVPIIGCGGSNSTKIGFEVFENFISSGEYGPAFALSNGTNGTYITYVSDRIVIAGKQLVIFRMIGSATVLNVGNVTTVPWCSQIRRQGSQKATAPRTASQTFSASAPTYTLTIGRSADPTGPTFTSQKTYEFVLDNKVWSDAQITLYEQYVGAKYAISSLAPVSTTVSTAPYVSALINTYSLKPTPVAADQIYIADSGASNAIKRSTAREVAVAGGTMYEAYPSTTDSWSDEFDEGSSDPTTRGWSVVQIYPTIAAMTRLGDVIYGIVPATAMSAGQYRSTVRNGRLYVQVGGNALNVVYIYKASSGAFAFATVLTNGAFGANAYGSLMLTDTVASAFGSAGAKSVYVERSNNIGTFAKFTGTTNTVYSGGSALAEPYRPLAVWIDWRAGSNLVDGAIMSGDSDTAQNTAGSQTPPTTWAPAFAGVMIRNHNASFPGWGVIDYIRRYPTGTFFPV